jgi:hypothetical protein
VGHVELDTGYLMLDAGCSEAEIPFLSWETGNLKFDTRNPKLDYRFLDQEFFNPNGRFLHT